MNLLAAILKYDYIAVLAVTAGVFSILNPVLVMLDECSWSAVFKTWAFTIVVWIFWIWAMEHGIVPGDAPTD
jgi:hypothetical protein